MRNRLSIKATLVLLGMLSGAPSMVLAEPAQVPARTLSVRHWLIEKNDAAALRVYSDDLAKNGIGWRDVGIDGEMLRSIESRVRDHKGRVPDAIQLSMIDVRSLGHPSILLKLDELAAQEHWADVIPTAVQKTARPHGHWIAVPAEIHRVNLLWINKRIFDKLKLKPPQTYAEMKSAAAVIRAAGYIPLAHGGEDWQNTLLFENVVLEVGGPKFYEQALVRLDPKAWRSQTMVQVFAQLLELRAMFDVHYSGRPWPFASAMLIRDKAAMQIMGDWAKHEFINAGMRPNTDFYCVPYPGTAGSFIYITDLFGMIDKGAETRPMQLRFASTIMDKKVHEKFSLIKGSIPVRTDISMQGFDACARASHADMRAAEAQKTLLGRYRLEIDLRADTFINARIHAFMQSNQTAQEAATQFADAVRDRAWTKKQR